MDSPSPVTGNIWQKDAPETHKLADNNPEMLARRAILLLENALQEDFGVSVHAGVEVECSYRIPEVLQQKLVNHLQQGAPRVEHNFLSGEKRSSYTPAYQRKSSRDPDDKHDLTINLTQMGIEVPNNRPIHHDGGDRLTQLPVTDCLFPDSNWISHSYCEDAPMQDGWAQYEHVISHEAPHDKIPFGEGRMLVLARATEALRKTIIETPSGRKQFAQDPLHNQWLTRVASGITERSIEAVSPTGVPQGMHINFSLTRNGRSILRFKEECDGVETHLGDMVNECDYLLLPSSKAYARRKQRHASEETHISDHFEITQPSSDSNPYYAMLVTLAGVYHALEQQGFSKKSGKFKGLDSTVSPVYPEPTGETETAAFIDRAPQRFFNGEGLLEKLLDRLDPGLGGEFTAAVRRMPPGTEKPRKDAGLTGTGVQR